MSRHDEIIDWHVINITLHLENGREFCVWETGVVYNFVKHYSKHSFLVGRHCRCAWFLIEIKSIGSTSYDSQWIVITTSSIFTWQNLLLHCRWSAIIICINTEKKRPGNKLMVTTYVKNNKSLYMERAMRLHERPFSVFDVCRKKKRVHLPVGRVFLPRTIDGRTCRGLASLDGTRNFFLAPARWIMETGSLCVVCLLLAASIWFFVYENIMYITKEKSGWEKRKRLKLILFFPLAKF